MFKRSIDVNKFTLYDKTFTIIGKYSIKLVQHSSEHRDNEQNNLSKMYNIFF